MCRNGSKIVLVAAGVITDKHDRVLVVRRDSGPWRCPESEVRFGDTLYETLRQHLLYDLGCTPLTVASQPDWVTQTIDAGTDRHFVCHFLRARLPDRIRPPALSGVFEVALVSQAGARRLEIAETSRTALRYVLGWHI